MLCLRELSKQRKLYQGKQNVVNSDCQAWLFASSYSNCKLHCPYFNFVQVHCDKTTQACLDFDTSNALELDKHQYQMLVHNIVTVLKYQVKSLINLTHIGYEISLDVIYMHRCVQMCAVKSL